MDIYQSLVQDHNRVKGLLRALVEASERDEDAETILDEIEEELVPHSRAEEAIFYNTLREESDWKLSQAADSYREHAQAETLLQTLMGMARIDSSWAEGVIQLRDAVEKHITEEEEQTFKIARQVFDAKEARQLGDAFEKAKEEVRQQSTLKNSAELVANMLPKRFADRVRQSILNSSF